jgi:hypothetical protein
MGNAVAPGYSPQFFQLILRGRRPQALIQIDNDWRALGDIVTRMLFWCGGCIHGCRCEADEMRFAVQVAHAPIGAMAQHISVAYAIRLRRLRGWRGSLFKHYAATPLPDESLLDDLVLWLHRPAGPHVWTGEAAYLAPHSSTWITTDRVRRTLPAPEVSNRRRNAQGVESDILDLMSRRRGRHKRPNPPNDSSRARRPSVETIARIVAAHCRVSFEEMCSASRKRAVSKAKVIATVLSTRNGATAAAAARLFHRSRSTLTERAEHYRKTQPQIFAEAESALAAYLETNGRETDRR